MVLTYKNVPALNSIHKPVEFVDTVDIWFFTNLTYKKMLFNEIKSKIIIISTDLSIMNVTIAIRGAASANTIKCFLTRTLSRPSCIRNETKPKAAGA